MRVCRLPVVAIRLLAVLFAAGWVGILFRRHHSGKPAARADHHGVAAPAKIRSFLANQ
jgi:hypothetical protein